MPIGGMYVKCVITPAIRASPPYQRTTPSLITPEPQIWLILRGIIGVLGVFYKKMFRGFAKIIFSALDRVLFPDLVTIVFSVFEFPGSHIHRRIVLQMPDFPSPLQYQGLQTLFGELFSGPTTGHSRSYNDRIV